MTIKSQIQNTVTNMTFVFFFRISVLSATLDADNLKIFYKVKSVDRIRVFDFQTFPKKINASSTISW